MAVCNFFIEMYEFLPKLAYMSLVHHDFVGTPTSCQQTAQVFGQFYSPSANIKADTPFLSINLHFELSTGLTLTMA